MNYKFESWRDGTFDVNDVLTLLSATSDMKSKLKHRPDWIDWLKFMIEKEDLDKSLLQGLE